MSQTSLRDLIGEGRTNAVVGWFLVAALVAAGVGSLVTGRLLWATFAFAVVALAVVPPIALRSPLAMLPWEVLLLAAMPALGLAVGAEPLAGHVASYLSVAAIALVVAVELQTFTTVRMTSSFAVLFVVVATLAAAALWAVFRWIVAGRFGVPFQPDHDAVLWEFVYSAIAGFGAGVVFELYFRRLGAAAARADPEAGLRGVNRD